VDFGVVGQWIAYLLDHGIAGLLAVGGIAALIGLGLVYAAVYSGALAAFGALVDRLVGGASRRRARGRRGLSGGLHAGRLWCPACRSIYSALDNACYGCGAPVATGVPLAAVPGGVPAAIPALPADLPTAEALEARWQRVHRLLSLAITGGVILALVALIAGVSPLLVAVVVALLVGSRILLVADPNQLSVPRPVDLIRRYEALLAIVAFLVVWALLLSPPVALGLGAVFGTAAFLMGRARAT